MPAIKSIFFSMQNYNRKYSHFIIVKLLTFIFLPLVSAISLSHGGVSNSTVEMITVSGMVVYGNIPVPGASVYLQVYDPQYYSVFDHVEKVAKTTKDGTFTFTIDSYKLNEPFKGTLPDLFVYDKLHAVGWQKLSKDINLENITIHLGDADAVGGMVKNNIGNPVEGAEVHITNMNLPYLGSAGFGVSYVKVLIPELYVKTDNNGRFIVNNLPEGSKLGVKIISPGYAEQSERGITVGTDTGMFELVPEGRIKGKVTYSDTAKPAEGVSIVATGFGAYRFSITDKNGVYIIHNLPEAKYNYTVRVCPEDSSEWTALPCENIIVEEDKTTEDIDFTLIKGGIITGRITDKDTGESLDGHPLTAEWPENVNRRSLDRTKTDKNGYYQLRVPTEKVKIHVYAPYGYENVKGEQIVEVRDGDTVTGIDFQFTKGISIPGKVVSPEGIPVEGVLLSKRFDRDHDASPTMTLKSDKNGTFTLRGLTEGTTISVKAEHRDLHYRGEGKIEVKPGAEFIINLEKYETFDIEGWVVDEDGNPMVDVGIHVVLFDSETGIGRSALQLVTDSKGKYRIENLIMGYKYSAHARAEGYADAQIPLPVEVANVPSLQDTPKSFLGKQMQSTEVVMYKTDRWIEGIISDEEGNPIQGARLTVNGGPSGFKTATSDSKGHYRLDFLVPVVEDRIMVDHKDFGYYNFRIVPTNKVNNFTLLKKQYLLEGKVVDVDRNPLEGVHVFVHPQRQKSGFMYMRVYTDKNGKFRMMPVVDEELDITLFHEAKGFETFEKVKTDRDDITFVFDKADELPERPEWEFDRRKPVFLEGNPTPELDVAEWVKGEPVKLADLKGKVVVLDFWMSSADYGIELLRLMKAVKKEYGDDGLVAIGIHEYTNDIEKLEKVIEENGITYRIAVDKKSPHADSFGLTFDTFGFTNRQDLLNYVIIDRDGNVHQDIRIPTIDKKIKELLKGSKRL